MKHKALLLAAIGIIIGLACAPVYRQLLWAVSTCQVPSSALVRKVSVSAAEALHTHEGMPVTVQLRHGGLAELKSQPVVDQAMPKLTSRR